ncbi:heme NO-binding domain-containing protein [Tateyamaria sp.]|uniref:heme NO-binding domain-containing protein n=1 Tax=Tateyamaria sp. TaxID=1929288 RepID=UPI003B21C7A3
MHGLINRAIQCFVTDSYGSDKWVEATRLADLDFVEFEAMLMYDDEITPRVLDAVSQVRGGRGNSDQLLRWID